MHAAALLRGQRLILQQTCRVLDSRPGKLSRQVRLEARDLLVNRGRGGFGGDWRRRGCGPRWIAAPPFLEGVDIELSRVEISLGTGNIIERMLPIDVKQRTTTANKTKPFNKVTASSIPFITIRFSHYFCFESKFSFTRYFDINYLV